MENLNHTIIGSSLNIMRATESNNPNNPVYPKHYSYDISNSNLDQMLEIMPDSFLFHLSGILNPLGNISSGNDFIYFDKGVESKIKLEIPFNFSINNLVIENTSSFSFNEESVLGGTLNIYLENKFPFDLDLQFYLMNEQDQLIDSLFHQSTTIMHGFTVNRIITGAAPTILKVNLTKNLLNKLSQTKNILIKARVNSDQNQTHQLYSHYGLDIKIVGDFDYAI